MEKPFICLTTLSKNICVKWHCLHSHACTAEPFSAGQVVACVVPSTSAGAHRYCRGCWLQPPRVCVGVCECVCVDVSCVSGRPEPKAGCGESGRGLDLDETAHPGRLGSESGTCRFIKQVLKSE